MLNIRQLEPAIPNKRRRLLSKTVLLQNDNALPHISAPTIDTIRNLKFEILKHPPYSPDLALSDFYSYCPLHEAIRGRRFGSNEEVKEAVHEQPNTYFSNGIKKLVNRKKVCGTAGRPCWKITHFTSPVVSKRILPSLFDLPMYIQSIQISMFLVTQFSPNSCPL